MKLHQRKSAWSRAMLAGLLAVVFLTTAAEAKDLVFGTYNAEKVVTIQGNMRALDELTKRTNGEITVGQRFFNGTVVKAADQLKAVGEGLVDIGSACTGYHLANLPLTSMLEMPYTTTKGDAFASSIVYMYENYEPFRQEYEKNNVIPLMWTAGSPNIIGLSKTISSPDELAGLKIRAYGQLGDIIRDGGGMIPVPMSATEIYSGLQTGVVDGYTGSTLWFPGPAGFLDLTKTIVDPGTGTYYTCEMIMNKDVYDGLSDSAKQAISEVRREMPGIEIKMIMDADQVTVDEAEKVGTRFLKFSDEEIERWKEKADYAGMRKKWIEERKSLTSADVSDFYDRFLAKLRELEKTSVYKQNFPAN